MESARDEKIAPTAHYTAFVWHRLGLPYGDLFATREGAALFWSFRVAGEWIAAALPNVPSMPQYLAQRHRAIEHTLATLRPDRVVEIGAGLSRRGITWAVDHDVDYVEVDLPHMTAAKRTAIESAPERVREGALRRLKLVSYDVLDDTFGSFLRAALHGAARPVVIAEGLLGYFELDERTRIVRAVRHGLDGRGDFPCDLRVSAQETGHQHALAVRALRSAIRLVTRGRGAARDFGAIEDVRRFFVGAGFASAEAVDLSTVPDVPRVPSPLRVVHARAAEKGPPST